MKASLLKVHSGWLCLILVVQTVTACTVQKPDSVQQPVTTIALEGTYLTSDKLQQCYVVTPANELIKFNTKGTLLFQYNNNRLGNLKWVDATDPFNVLLFYPEYYTVVTLDRTLNITGEYQLYNLDIAEVEAVGMSNDNNLWLYDETAGKLKKISRQGKMLAESADLRLLLGTNIQPVSLVEHNNMVYINVPETGILVFDNFGTYTKQIPITGLSYFQLLDQQMLYIKDDQLYSLHLESLLTAEVNLPFSIGSTDKLSVRQGVVFSLNEKELRIYRL